MDNPFSESEHWLENFTSPQRRGSRNSSSSTIIAPTTQPPPPRPPRSLYHLRLYNRSQLYQSNQDNRGPERPTTPKTSSTQASSSSSSTSFLQKQQYTTQPSPQSTLHKATMDSLAQSHVSCLRSNNVLRVALILVIAGAVNMLIGGSIIHMRKVNGSYNSTGDSSLYQLAIGTIIFLIGLFCVLFLWLYRNGALAAYLGRFGGHTGHTMADRINQDIELGDMGSFIRPAASVQSISTRPSFSSQAPLLPQRPELVYLAPAPASLASDSSFNVPTPPRTMNFDPDRTSVWWSKELGGIDFARVRGGKTRGTLTSKFKEEFGEEI